MKVTRHRDKILAALREWFRIHKQAPTLEEFCAELGMQPRQKATLQRWLQTMRGIDVEWEDNAARSLRFLTPEPDIEPGLQIPVTETLRYLATGLVEWEKQEPMNRAHIPKALRVGMSRMHLTSLLSGDEQAPSSLPEFFNWAKKPVLDWQPAAEIKHLSSEVTLIEDGLVSDFALQWQVTGADVEMQVQEKVLQDVLEYCRVNQLEEAYRALRKLIIECPVLPYSQYRRLLSSSQLRPLRDFLLQMYVDLVDLTSDPTYHFCSRCKYVMRRRRDGTYNCRNMTCEQLSAKLRLPPQASIPKHEAEDWKALTPGVHRYGTLPGLWEIQLAETLTKLGVHVTLWPEIDQFDLLVEFSKKVRWAIDVKDWSYLDEERLRKVDYRFDTTETFIVFPDERNDVLRIEVERQRLEPGLGGVRLKLVSEIISQAKKILEKKNHA
ncbi:MULTISPECIES: Fis family transcriptional regulator [Nostoc]|uniref:Fis family transcriptional regulator n=3 Tax=Nostoc TaxID=1177 RepID=A0ABR8IIB2_9NOSO|nr:MULTISPECIES: Fis family transcriptional regulator [Nostoc]MBD2565104.1 Fis family transcriptional regulator [Nostoc linckia FACHB-391]MBD2650697.1 Fis family transcriptional regulator [Nostoc foliaceum FACHB-393]MBE9001055.1 Fis family transcriptional regulator [Nostoc sp. LEGE 12447]NEU80989.1 Fis family transcriptional regulator [Nostoc sp. UIC 10630]